MKKLDAAVKRMKRVANSLVPYSYPYVKPEDEEEINLLKFCSICVDGYDVIMHFNRQDYRSHYLETFQVLGQECPFLPFALIFKLTRKFLGSECLSLVEVFGDTRKIYCWNVLKDRKGKAMPNPYQENSKTRNFEGFNYCYLAPNQIKFY